LQDERWLICSPIINIGCVYFANGEHYNLYLTKGENEERGNFALSASNSKPNTRDYHIAYTFTRSCRKIRRVRVATCGKECEVNLHM
jgi:hypothetical protein